MPVVVEAELTVDAPRDDEDPDRRAKPAGRSRGSEVRSPIAQRVADEVASWIAEQLDSTDALVLSDYAKGSSRLTALNG